MTPDKCPSLPGILLWELGASSEGKQAWKASISMAWGLCMKGQQKVSPLQPKQCHSDIRQVSPISQSPPRKGPSKAVTLKGLELG